MRLSTWYEIVVQDAAGQAIDGAARGSLFSARNCVRALAQVHSGRAATILVRQKLRNGRTRTLQKLTWRAS
jgi:hypothetical protein